ncbi:GNAT superfamily N-acetyltransferase [Weissella uvarum]|uniref:GNAT family N-acetyltransferase n=1 Tax=Weissella uvarum TaxID=1479233 RepID=UPI001961254B|nr:GNAT family N-acetyltransferase [Weissella uvarum]MBM7617031.1 GNAT superfamily N-acetyltransferase [Weissella uvarum]MCM0595329.1 GNAT family N-acetyltransferase [Weissella uvarum]
MITFEPIMDEQYWEKIYLEAFPERERTPYAELKALADEKSQIKMRTIMQDAKPIGLLVWVEITTHKAFILYFAVDQSLRGGGFGSKILTALKAKFDEGIILEAEYRTPEAENAEQRERRYAFYEKNQVTDSGFASRAFGGIYHLMRSDVRVTVEDYLQAVQVLSDYPTAVAPSHSILALFPNA